ncbi:unnamed protein product [Mytilus edulis]|uniref:Uncharacterized protein n=1 Tax=Mytilus edulis TaxID=6550 RepID=A0A8S3S8A9_MYTED|nr:unnamed protein product [Mytilus edulis]
MPEITPVKMNMMTATGEISPFIGEFEAYLRLGKNLIKHKVLVADMPTEGILGMDFLTNNECDVLLSKSCIRYRGQEWPCFKYKNAGQVSCCRISIYEKIVLPPSSETIVSGIAVDPIVRGKTGLVEPVKNFVEKHGLLIAKAVVQPNSGFIPIKILNLSNVEHVIQKNTVAAMLEPVEADMIEPCQNINAVGSTETNAENIPKPDHIQTVYGSNINELSENQKV